MRQLTVVLVITVLVSIVESKHLLHKLLFHKMHHLRPIKVYNPENLKVTELHVEQKLDHFDRRNLNKWKMRVFCNSEFYRRGGPIMLLIGWDWEISEEPLLGGLVYDMANDHYGYLCFIEHRYYGASIPVKTLTMMNLKYLTVKQSLADIKTVIRYIKKYIQPPQNTKIILIGAGYSGTLATQFKRRYSTLVHGVWGSSALLFPILSYQVYKAWVGVAINYTGGTECYNRIENGIKALKDDIVKQDMTRLNQFLDICSDFDPANNKSAMTFSDSLSDMFSAMVEDNNADGIDRECRVIMAERDDATGALSWLRSYLRTICIDATGTECSECIDVTYQGLVDELRNTEVTNNMRKWFYRQCNELGWFREASGDKQLFGEDVPLNFFIELCSDVFDQAYTVEIMAAKVLRTAMDFIQYPEPDGIFVSTGVLNPWISLTGESSKVSNYSYVKDLESMSADDTRFMTKLKVGVDGMVDRWICIPNGWRDNANDNGQKRNPANGAKNKKSVPTFYSANLLTPGLIFAALNL